MRNAIALATAPAENTPSAAATNNMFGAHIIRRGKIVIPTSARKTYTPTRSAIASLSIFGRSGSAGIHGPAAQFVFRLNANSFGRDVDVQHLRALGFDQGGHLLFCVRLH